MSERRQNLLGEFTHKDSLVLPAQTLHYLAHAVTGKRDDIGVSLKKHARETQEVELCHCLDGPSERGGQVAEKRRLRDRRRDRRRQPKDL